MAGKTILVASIGFTADFVARRVNDLTREAVAKVVAVGLDAGDRDAWRRVEQAYGLLASYLSALGIPSELVRVSLDGLMSGVREVVARAREEARSLEPRGSVEVYVTGGPRILVAAMILEALMVEAEEAAGGGPAGPETRIVVYGEGFERKLEVDTARFLKLLTLDETSWRIVRALVDGKSAGQLLRELSMPKSTLYKKLGELRSAGIVTTAARQAGVWILDPRVRDLVA